MWVGLWTVRVHRQIIFGSRETHSGIYRTGGSDGDVIVGTCDLAGSEKHGLPFSLSGIVPCLVLLSVCDRLYTEPVFPGHAGLSRTLNAVKITYLLLLFLNEIYWIGWLRQLLEKRAEQTTGQLTIQKWAIRNGAAALVVLCADRCGMSCDLPGIIQSGGSLFFLRSLLLCAPGEAYNFHQEYLERVEFCPDRKRCAAAGLSVPPVVFVHGRNLRGCGQ